MLDAHEKWSYVTSSRPAIAKLENILIICRLCHGCVHFRHTHLRLRLGYITWAQIEEIIRHYCNANRVSCDDFWDDFKKADKLWKLRSKQKWKINYGKYEAVIEEKVVSSRRKAAKLKLDRRTDSEPIEPLPFAKRSKSYLRRAMRREM